MEIKVIINFNVRPHTVPFYPVSNGSQLIGKVWKLTNVFVPYNENGVISGRHSNYQLSGNMDNWSDELTTIITNNTGAIDYE